MPNPFPVYRSLNPRGVSSFHHGPRSPSERLTSPEPPTSQPASTSLGLSALRRHHSIEPRMQQAVPGPLRFRSQAFSASQRFPSTPGLRGLVSCRSRPWGSPYRALILAGVAVPSRVRQLPCSSPPPYLRCDARGRVLRVSPTPALSRGGLDPPGAPTSFPPLASQRLPRRLEPRAPSSPRVRWLRLLRSVTPPTKPLHATLGSPLAPPPVLSWVSAPPEPSSGRASGPVRPGGPFRPPRS